jgi:acyl-CoA dehydrogenase
MFSLELSDEQKIMQKSAREFALKSFTKQAAEEYESKQEFPWELYRRVAAQGYIGSNWPQEYGGQGLGLMDEIVVSYELMRVDPPLASAVLAGAFGSDLLAFFGTHEQKSKWLPRVAKGEVTSAACFTEPAGGSDISRVLDTRAVRRNSRWVINGTKTFITNGTTASFLVTLAQTDSSAKPPHKGQTEFVVERSEKIQASAFKNKMGWLASPTAEVRFNDAEVGDEDILGGVQNLNMGFYLGLRFLSVGRLIVGLQGVTTADAALERAIEYSKERTAFGKKIGGYQALAFRLVEMATKVEHVKTFALRTASVIERSFGDFSLAEEAVRLSSMLKWYATRTAVEACDLALDVMAGYGYIGDDVQRWYRFAKVLEIVEGTKEIQKNTIARIMLGREIAGSF